MTTPARALPKVPAPFPPEFMALLHTLLARGARTTGAREEQERARRTVLSQSGTFVGHRPYVRGDDLRQLDWAAYARSGELFTKQLEEPDRRTATLLLDLSPRLLVGDPPRRLAMLRLAAIVGGLVLTRLDGLTVVAPGAGTQRVVNFFGAGALPLLLRHLEALPITTSPPTELLELVLARGVPPRVHWISDFAQPKAIERPLAALRRAGAKVTGWLPALATDREPPRSGYLRLADPATGDELVVPIDASFAAAVAEQLALLARQQLHLFAQAGAPLVRWPAPARDDFRPAAWLPIVAGSAR